MTSRSLFIGSRRFVTVILAIAVLARHDAMPCQLASIGFRMTMAMAAPFLETA
jgi:hypothetical protein